MLLPLLSQLLLENGSLTGTPPMTPVMTEKLTLMPVRVRKVRKAMPDSDSSHLLPSLFLEPPCSSEPTT